MSNLIIWGRNNSSNVQKIMWALQEMQIPFERRDAGGAFGLVQEAAYKAMNPNSRVPTLQIGDFALYESNAILRFLGERSGQFVPKDNFERAKMNQWLDWQQTTLIPPLTPVFWGLVRTPPEKRNLQEIAEYALKTTQAFEILEENLAVNSFCVGENLSLADFALGPMCYRYFELVKERPALPHLTRWFGQISARAAFVQHVSSLGLT
jgi:glutathione S-transferase